MAATHHKPHTSGERAQLSAVLLKLVLPSPFLAAQSPFDLKQFRGSFSLGKADELVTLNSSNSGFSLRSTAFVEETHTPSGASPSTQKNSHKHSAEAFQAERRQARETRALRESLVAVPERSRTYPITSTEL